MGGDGLSNLLKKILGVFIFGEIFLLGSGQLILLSGGFSLKMFNYGLMLLFSFFVLISNRFASKDILQLLGVYAGTILIGIFMSILNNGLDKLSEDLSPLFYFFTLLFFDQYISRKEDIFFIRKLLLFSALLMAGIYIVYIGMIKAGVLNFDMVYLLAGEKSDIMFRGTEGAFFYKGFLYLVIGMVFYIAKGKMLSWQVGLLLLAVYFTQTRGFLIIAVCACIFYIFYWLYTHRFLVPIKYLIICLSVFAVISFYATIWYESFVGVDRSAGDAVRVQTIQEVMQQITFLSFWVGHGFGIGVPIRPIHMEMSYLEIFHKQGIIGLLFWGYLLFKFFVLFVRIPVERKCIGLPFLLSAIVIYIQSLFNPFLNNPIGMAFILISYVSLKRIGELDFENTI